MAETGRERKVIKVANVATPRKVGKGEVLPFKCEDGEVYEAWAKPIKELVKIGAELDADIVHTENEKDGQVYKHHKVDQVYVDGQPVKKAFSGGWGNKGGAADPVERASIEAQTAYNGIIQLRVHDKLEETDKRLLKALEWAETKLDENMHPPIQGSQEESQGSKESKPSKPAENKQEKADYELMPDGSYQLKDLPIADRLIKGIPTMKRLQDMRDEIAKESEGFNP